MKKINHIDSGFLGRREKATKSPLWQRRVLLNVLFLSVGINNRHVTSPWQRLHKRNKFFQRKSFVLGQCTFYFCSSRKLRGPCLSYVLQSPNFNLGGYSLPLKQKELDHSLITASQGPRSFPGLRGSRSAGQENACSRATLHAKKCTFRRTFEEIKRILHLVSMDSLSGVE